MTVIRRVGSGTNVHHFVGEDHYVSVERSKGVYRDTPRPRTEKESEFCYSKGAQRGDYDKRKLVRTDLRSLQSSLCG